MRLAVMCAAWIGVAVFAAGEPLLAQLRDNSEKQMTCQNNGLDSHKLRHGCSLRNRLLGNGIGHGRKQQGYLAEPDHFTELALGDEQVRQSRSSVQAPSDAVKLTQQ
jgi:hypothetical protein